MLFLSSSVNSSTTSWPLRFCALIRETFLEVISYAVPTLSMAKLATPPARIPMEPASAKASWFAPRNVKCQPYLDCWCSII